MKVSLGGKSFRIWGNWGGRKVLGKLEIKKPVRRSAFFMPEEQIYFFIASLAAASASLAEPAASLAEPAASLAASAATAASFAASAAGAGGGGAISGAFIGGGGGGGGASLLQPAKVSAESAAIRTKRFMFGFPSLSIS